MKAAPLLISWHNENTPIYSAHFEPHGKGRLATAGGDNNVRVSSPFHSIWDPTRRKANCLRFWGYEKLEMLRHTQIR
jgi:hypothetical protein